MIISVSSISYAQTQPQKGPHEGSIESAGKYLVELTRSHANIFFYVLDIKTTTISNKDVKGPTTFEFIKHTKVTSTLNNTDKDIKYR
ncbi:MAG: hypothetical protein H7282_00790, partial [Cytophagaceae bacterium]|nr:hypothetical protein [Cytophagaceae bacterium]